MLGCIRKTDLLVRDLRGSCCNLALDLDKLDKTGRVFGLLTAEEVTVEAGVDQRSCEKVRCGVKDPPR